ncbi:UDP-N-acetylmuramoyl-tripeptide--D-alanyl-D-alanine ligase [Candidatus Brocadiaceae bacterium]|nr:UDP-N-acetylmuramoyl-tripeptide--D-alanyl-D-alanine ligase [Candidatus Brocadiaceae bacterium]
MEFFVLVILFWLPPVIIFFKNAVWNLSLWQQKQYRFERFFSYIRWDHLPDNRELTLGNLKFIVFALVCTLAVSIYSASIGILLAYVIWTIEIFLLLGKVIGGKSESIKISWRNTAIIITLSVLVSLLITVITLPFASINRPETQEVIYLPQFIPEGRDGIPVIPDVYVYLGISSIFALFLDIAAPIILGLIVFLTSPIGWLKNKLAVFRLKDKISRYRNNLTVIAVTGSIGKTVTKEFLHKLLKNDYNVVKTSDIYTTIEELSYDITSAITDDTQILLVEVEPFRKGEISEIAEVLKPDISIITDIDVQHYGAFKSKKDYIDARLELIEGTNPNGTVIAPIDNKYILHYMNAFKGQKIGFTFLNKKSSALNTLATVEIYKRSVKGFKFMIKTKESINEYQTPIHRTTLIHQLVPAIVAAEKLGATQKTIREKVNKLSDKFTNIYTLEGDEHTLLISTGTPDSNLKGILAAVDYASNIKKKFSHNRILLITDGVSELGKIKRKSYARLVEKLKYKVSIVLTSDPLLYELLSKSYLDLLAVKTRSTEETLFNSRLLLKSGDIIIVEGKDAHEILDSLRSQE